MTQSLFSRLYARRATDKKNQKENFLTEAFSILLESDKTVLSSFYKLIKAAHIELVTQPLIETQCHFPGLGRPDLSILGDNYWVLIEAKMESREGENQLPNYSRILMEKSLVKENRILVYLTKYPEQKEKPEGFEGVFIEILWDKIFHIINADSSELAKQFKHFLKELNMDNIYRFNPNDLSGLLNLHALMKKLDFYLDAARKEFGEKINSNISTNRMRYSRLKHDNGYYNVSRYHYGHIDLGIVWWDGTPEVYLYIAVLLNKSTLADFASSEKEKFDQFFKGEEWSDFDNTYFVGYQKTKPISQLLSEENQEETIQEWYSERIAQVKKLVDSGNGYFSGPITEIETAE